MLDGDDSESYGDGDILYYHKDDLTNYSWHLDLNKVSWKDYWFWPMSELGYLEERSDDSRDNQPFNTAISEVEWDSSVNENWNMRFGHTKNNFLNRKQRRNKLNNELRNKWMMLNSLYGDDFKWAWGLYSGGGNGRPRSVSGWWKTWKPEGFYGTLRPIHLRETHLSWASYS